MTLLLLALAIFLVQFLKLVRSGSWASEPNLNSYGRESLGQFLSTFWLMYALINDIF